MKILYIAREVNHHLLPFVESLERLFPGEVYFATIDKYELRRAVMHFPKFERDWIFTIGDNKEKFHQLFFNADVVLSHAWDFHQLMKERLALNKITFYFSERWFRPPYGKIRLLKPSFLKIYLKFRNILEYKNFYYLAQGVYAASDFRSVGLCTKKIFSFGYFTSTQKTPATQNYLPTDKINILWCGRLVSCKNVDKLVKAVIALIQQGYQDRICLTIIGEGPQESLIRSMIKQYSQISLLKFMSTSTIRMYMNLADIYVFPSSAREGWGAVVNEAMSEGCALIGSQFAGSVKSMVTDTKNGLLLKDISVQEIKDKIQYLVDQPSELSRLKQSSVDCMKNWSPDNVAARFVSIVHAIQRNASVDLYSEGAMSLL